MSRIIKVTLELVNSDGRNWKKTYSTELDNIAFIKQDMNLIHSYMGTDIAEKKYSIFL